MLLFFCFASFEDSLRMDRNFIAGPLRTIAGHTYDMTQFSHGITADNGNIQVSSVNMNIKDEAWHVRPWYSQNLGRTGLSGSVYVNTHNNKVIVGLHGSYWLEDWIRDLQVMLVDASEPHGGLRGTRASRIFSAYSKLIFTYGVSNSSSNGRTYRSSGNFFYRT